MLITLEREVTKLNCRHTFKSWWLKCNHISTTFLEPGGDADFLIKATNGFWKNQSGGAIATDFVHGGHKKSIKYAIGAGDAIAPAAGTITDTGTRISVYIYLVVLPTATATIIKLRAGGSPTIATLRLTSAGVLQLWNGVAVNQIGTDGATLSTGVWYRISLAYTITSTTVNRFELFKDGASTISITNATLGSISTGVFLIGNVGADTTLDLRTSDHYIDNSNSLTDTGDIWVTAKRPNANGTTNGFSTQIGAGGSGYGSGHSPQVNERALSTTNGWSMIGAGSAITEEYNIEGKATGDIDISTATIVDWLGWVSTKSLVGETVNVIINGASVAQAITSTITLYTKIKGSATYPAGTGTDIGIQTDTSLTTVSLYECGIIVAYIPASGATVNSGFFQFM